MNIHVKTYRKSQKQNRDLDSVIIEKRAIDFLVKCQEAKTWIEECIKEPIAGTPYDLITQLRNGVYLCKLANLFTKNSIKKIHSVKSGNVLEFMAIENLNNFLKACKSLNFPEYNQFTVPDIWERKNVIKVVFF